MADYIQLPFTEDVRELQNFRRQVADYINSADSIYARLSENNSFTGSNSFSSGISTDAINDVSDNGISVNDVILKDGSVFETWASNIILNFTNSMTVSEMQIEIDKLPKLIPYGKIIYIEFEDGSYNFSNQVLQFEGFKGPGYLYVQALNYLNSASDGGQNVTINNGRFYFTHCSCYVGLHSINFYYPSYNQIIYILQCTNFSVYYCKITGQSQAYVGCVRAGQSHCSVISNYIDDVGSYSFSANSNSTIILYTNYASINTATYGCLVDASIAFKKSSGICAPYTTSEFARIWGGQAW
jgi:hypothetical protein